jgi:hypothetical protein
VKTSIKEQVVFVTDATVKANSARRNGPRTSKYLRMTDAIAKRPNTWGVLYTSQKNHKAHMVMYHLRKRYTRRADGTPYMEFKVFRNPTLKGTMRWSVAGRLPQENAL